METLRQTLVLWDYKIWYYLNASWHNDFLDAVIPFFRNQYFWAPVYLFFLVFMPYNYGRKGWFWCVGFLLSFAMADYISASMIKPFLHRTRPCNNPYLSGLVHIIVPCGSGYSFPSSHATNHFAMGVFVAGTLGRVHRWIAMLALFWALLIAYSQVYVGVHFPLDVFCGALLGTVIGMLVSRFFNYRYGLTMPVSGT